MDNKQNTPDSNIDEMLKNIEQTPVNDNETGNVDKKIEKKKKKKKSGKKQTKEVINPIFNKFKIKDIVFLSIIAAVTLLTGGIMPLIGQIPVFGIIHLCLGFQFSFFITIGLLKVKKPGSLLYMTLLVSIIISFMNFGMFFALMLCALLTEIISVIVFRKKYRTAACQVFQGTIFFPLSMPFMFIWYKYLYTWTGDEGNALNAFMGAEPPVVAGISVAVVALTFVSSLLEYFLMKELKSAGVVKE